MGFPYFLRLEDFYHNRFSTGLDQLRPSGRIGRKTAYKIVNTLHRAVPVNTTSIFEDFRCRTQFTHDGHFFLRNTFHCTGKNGIYGFYHQATAQQHQFVVDDTHVVRIGNGYPYLLDNLTGVNLMFQEESGDARFRITINHRPVDGGCAAILRKQGSMQVEGAQSRHVPYHLRQHAESNDYLQIGLPCTQRLHKSLILQLLRLKKRKIMFQCILLHRRKLEFMSPSGRLVGHRNDTHHIVTSFYQTTKSLHRKVGSTHIYNPQILLFHHFIYSLPFTMYHLRGSSFAHLQFTIYNVRSIFFAIYNAPSPRTANSNL